MITTKKPDTIWTDLDNLVENSEIPENAITTKMIMEKYKLSNCTALRYMDTLIREDYIAGYGKKDGRQVKYIIPKNKK